MTAEKQESYVSKLRTGESFDTVVREVTSAFKDEGFGVLSDLNMSETLSSKLGIDMPRYRLLGMCNPSLAHKALMVEPDVGVLLPCNVAVYEREGAVVVAAQDPGAMLEVTANLGLEEIADEAVHRVQRAMATLRDRLG